MKVLLKLLTVLTALLSAGIVQASGLTRPVSVHEYFLSNSLSMQNFLSNKLEVKNQDTGDLRSDIYEFHSKSPYKAFVYSLIIPGAGEFYTGSRIKAGSFLAIDAILWTGYLIYHGKGTKEEKDYKLYADAHYIASEYNTWWGGLDSSVQNTYSHRLYFDASGNPIRTREYYENVGKYDQFQVGWDDIGLNYPPPPIPGGSPVVSPHRSTYLGMRATSNNYFSNATTMAMVSIANHLVSAFDAAIGARKFNRGNKQYSMQFESRNIDGKVAPFVVLQTKF
jgi:hypothetical protein